MTPGQGLVAAQFALLTLIVAGGRRRPARPAPVHRAGQCLMLAGAVLAFSSGHALGRNLTPLPAPVPGGTLIQTGPYRWVRHPLYTALLLLSAGWTAGRGGPVSGLGTALLTLVLRRKARMEETALAAAYPAYPAYRQRTGAFLPRR